MKRHKTELSISVSRTLIKILNIVLIPILFGACSKDSKLVVEEYEVVLVNLWKKKPVNGGNNRSEYHARLTQTAEIMRQQNFVNGRSWDFIGLNECFYLLDNNRRAVPQRIPCNILGDSAMAGESFNAHLMNANQVAGSNLQFGGNGQNVRSGLTQVGPILQAYLPLFMGGAFQSTRIYSVVGGRFQLKSGRILPVWVIKLPTQTSSSENRRSQTGGAVNHIKQMWVPGDLTPLLMGDINSNPLGEIGQKLGEDFVEITQILPATYIGIETIWMGKEKKFPGACGTLEFVERQVWTEARDGGNTDHPIIYARFRPQLWEGSRILNTPPLVMTVDRPALCGELIAWTEVGSNGYIHLSKLADAGSQPGSQMTYEDVWSVGWPDANHDIRSLRGPALEYHNQRTYLAWTGWNHNNVNVMSTTYPRNTSWERRTKHPFPSDCAPALAVLGDRVYLSWKEQGSNRIMITYSDDEGISWIPAHYVNGASTSQGPALVEFKGNLVLAWINNGDGRLIICHLTGQNQLDMATFQLLGDEDDCYDNAACRTSKFAPYLLSVKAEERSLRKALWPEIEDRLYLLWTGNLDNYVRVMSSPDGKDWKHAVRVTDAHSRYAPSARFTGVRDGFVLAWAQNDNNIVQLRETMMGGELSLDVRK